MKEQRDVNGQRDVALFKLLISAKRAHQPCEGKPPGKSLRVGLRVR